MKKLLLIPLAALATLLTVSCNKTIKPDSISNEPFVDMGVSVKWASCNVGADAPEKAGDFLFYSEALTVKAPTNVQVEELLANCTRKRAKLKGVKGSLLTSKTTGNSIFFPIVGWYWKDDPELRGNGEGDYWTATSIDEEKAYSFYMSLENTCKEYPEGLRLDLMRREKTYKLPVRPVQ